MVDHLLRYARRLGARLRTGHRVDEVRGDGDGFLLTLADGSQLGARAVVAAAGGFGCPRRPAPASPGAWPLTWHVCSRRGGHGPELLLRCLST
ncbi:FAD-dependent oxidoreductase [Streptomyces sp. NPDC093707]|uniref:FAD-dependent oxidoreductase n=1 Tax=Streptomyces sp. NPDC093707 TaxID=3154984 RepID=UPI00344D015C